MSEASRPTVVAFKRAGGRPVIRLDRPVERGEAIEVPAAELPALPDGEYYAFQLVGLAVEDEAARLLGRVAEVRAGCRERRARARHGHGSARSSRTASGRSISTAGRIVIAAGFVEIRR